MTLHEAIQIVLEQFGRSMTANEIADELNSNKLYSKRDGSRIKSGQVSARVNNYPDLFSVSRAESLNKIDLKRRARVSVENPSRNTDDTRNEARTIETIPKEEYITSFKPVSTPETSILVLGTMPGDMSLATKEYYAHPRNKFWKIIAEITNNDLPETYADKIALLNKNRIGLWDVAHRATRKGSLDRSIEQVVPNDLDGFENRHNNLEVIGFNGQKAEKLYEQFFRRKEGIRYISLPSTSPANTGLEFAEICEKWRQILS